MTPEMRAGIVERAVSIGDPWARDVRALDAALAEAEQRAEAAERRADIAETNLRLAVDDLTQRAAETEQQRDAFAGADAGSLRSGSVKASASCRGRRRRGRPSPTLGRSTTSWRRCSMEHVDYRLVVEACESIRQRDAGAEWYDTIRRRLAEEIGGCLSVVLEQDHDIYLVTGPDYRRLRALDDALRAARGPRP